MGLLYPNILRNWIYPLSQKVQNREYAALMAAGSANQFLRADELQALQWKKLSALLNHAYQTVPHYREKFNAYGIKPADIQDWDDYKHVPILTKDDYRQESEKFISERPRSGIYPIPTSGSTGTPTNFYLSQASSGAANVSRIRALRWWGIELGDREVRLATDWIRFMPGFWEPAGQRWKRFYRDRLMNRRTFPSNEMTHEFMQDLWHFALRYRPRYLLGYAGALYTLARFLKKEGYDGRQLELVASVTYGEVLYEWQAHAIREFFDCPVVDEYGATEVGVIAYLHPCGEYHTMDDFILVEIIKANPLDAYGEVVVTLLENFSCPLIRYNLQDLAVPFENASPCPLGIGLGRLQNIIGRSHDLIILADGKVVHGQVFSNIMAFVPNIRRFQFVQKSFDRFELFIEVDGKGLSAKDERHIRVNLYETLGQIELQIIPVNEIPGERSGKFRFVRSEVNST